MDQRREDYKVESACTLQKMLNQPYVAPVLTYEKKAEQPHERAYIQKAQTYGRSRKGEPVQIVKQALAAQNERFQDQLHGKDNMLQR